MRPDYLIRALRLPFLSASLLPFIFGSLIERKGFDWAGFFLGLCAVAFMHLGANVLNDYADSRSRADWQDKRFFGFFGGSKLIQEGLLSERFYLALAVTLGVFSAAAIFLLALHLRKADPVFYFLAVLFLSWAYSAPPLKLSYRRFGEAVIFLLFGPVPVMAGYYIQTGIFPDLKSFFLSLPLGLLTVNILFANEVPDFPDDEISGKFNWVSLIGQKKAFLLYLLFALLAQAAVAAGVILRLLHPATLFSFVALFPALKAASILRENYSDKEKLVGSSKMTIMAHTLTGLILILGAVI